MDAAVIGLIGVVIGGLLTIGFQVIQARLARQRDARAAARILVVALSEAIWQLRGAQKHNGWAQLTGFQHAVDAYDRADITALARHLNRVDFTVVGWAFAILRYYERVRARGRERRDSEEGYSTVSSRLGTDLERLVSAATVAWAASASWRDRSDGEVDRRKEFLKSLDLSEDRVPWLA
jgi:hypothetical protein